VKKVQPTYSVLIAEDAADVAWRLEELLAEWPALTLLPTARTGMEVLTTLKAQRVDIALLDFQLPELNAAQILARLDAGDRPGLVIVHSAYDDPEFRTASLSAGAHHFLHKREIMSKLKPILDGFLDR